MSEDKKKKHRDDEDVLPAYWCPANEHEVPNEGDLCTYSQGVEPVDHVSDHASPGFGISMNRNDYKRTPSVTGGANYFPGTEEWLPVGEMRISFLGTAPYPPRLRQSGTSILVELGQGILQEPSTPGSQEPKVKIPQRPKRLIFDAGPGSSKMATALQVPWQEIDTFFLSHLHGDHIIELGYYFCFGAWGGRWTPLTIVGPDGSDGIQTPVAGTDTSRGATYPIYNTADWNFDHESGVGTPVDSTDPTNDSVTFGKEGVVAMVEGMKRMYHWHSEAFSMFPAGDGYEVNVHQFHHNADTGGTKKEGLAYVESWGSATDYGGVQEIKVYHWNRVHGKTGASGYRLEWSFTDENGTPQTLKFVWTGDGRPNDLTIDNNTFDGTGEEPVDVFVTECQMDNPDLMALKYGIPAGLYAYTIDTHHTVPYAVGELMKKCNPRIGMVTHFEYDRDTMTEFIAGLRYHWNGMFALGAPDGIIVNATKDAIWYREAAVPDYSGTPSPSVDWAQSWQSYYDNNKEGKDWRHESNEVFAGTTRIPVPNAPYSHQSNVDSAIRETEQEACAYYPPEVNRERITETEDDVVLDVSEMTGADS